VIFCLRKVEGKEEEREKERKEKRAKPGTGDSNL
jgi:hypothetical protein